MPITRTQAMCIALIPPFVEELEKLAKQKSHFALRTIAIEIRHTRTLLYQTIALTVFTAAGAALSARNGIATKQYTLIAVLSGALTAAVAKKLFDATSPLFLR